MCGLLFGHRNDGKPIAKALIKRYQEQGGRGKQGFGYITIENDKVTKIERATHEHEILKLLREETASSILFHHRIPTSTENTIDTTHPFVVKHKMLSKNYYLIHNGHIANCNELYKDHQVLGFEYGSLEEVITEIKCTKKTRRGNFVEKKEKSEFVFNDSESLAVDFALTIEGFQDRLKSRGAIAFICIQTDKKDMVEKIYYGKNYNPLNLESGEDMFFLKSEGRGNSIEADVLYIVDWKTGKIVANDFQIGVKHIAGFQKNSSEDWKYEPTAHQGKGHLNEHNEWVSGDKKESIPSPFYGKGGMGRVTNTPKLLEWDDGESAVPLLESGDHDRYNSDAEKYFKDQENKKLVELYEERDQLIADIDFAQESIININSIDGRDLHPEDLEEKQFFSLQSQEDSKKLAIVEAKICEIETELEQY